MSYYYANKNTQPSVGHEAHALGCDWLPAQEDRICLGAFDSCWPSDAETSNDYTQANRRNRFQAWRTQKGKEPELDRPEKGDGSLSALRCLEGGGDDERQCT